MRFLLSMYNTTLSSQVFQSIGVHAGLVRHAVRELLSATDETKQTHVQAQSVARSLRQFLSNRFSTFFDYKATDDSVTLHTFDGDRLSAIAEILHPAGLRHRLQAIRDSADSAQLRELWPNYLFGEKSIGEFGGLFAELMHELPVQSDATAAIGGGVQRGDILAAAGLQSSSPESRLKLDLVTWLDECDRGAHKDWWKLSGADLLKAVVGDAHRSRYPSLSVIQVCKCQSACKVLFDLE